MDKNILVKMLSRRAGYDVATPHGAEQLQKEIEALTGERLSVNTLKRLVGILPYKGEQRASTLDIIARYLGFRDSKELQAFMEGNGSDFSLPPNYTDLPTLKAGDTVIMEWSPGRRITMRRLADGRYSLTEAINSKLKEGDILDIGVVAEGLPLMARDVIREGSSLGPYIAAPEGGVTKVEIKH